MAKKKDGKRKTARVRDLSARKGSDAKGGLQTAFSNALKSVGEGLSTMARKG
jgi:hypothetical protein